MNQYIHLCCVCYKELKDGQIFEKVKDESRNKQKCHICGRKCYGVWVRHKIKED